MSKALFFDGNHTLHRAFSVAAGTRNIKTLDKSTLTLFLTLIASDIIKLRGTHALVVFDSPRPFRLDIYKDYKGNRLKKKTSTDVTLRDGSKITVPMTAGMLVKEARRVIELAGITHAYVKGYEGDDLLGCAAETVEGPKVVIARDKDMAGLANEETDIYWSVEKRLLKVKDVRQMWGIEPHQMRDYLCLLGDKIDNIPGVDGIGPKTAVKILTQYGSIGAALKSKEWGPKLLENKKTLILARRLVTLRKDITFKLEDLVINDVSQELAEHVWTIPTAVKDLGEARKAQKMKGLFG